MIHPVASMHKLAKRYGPKKWRWGSFWAPLTRQKYKLRRKFRKNLIKLKKKLLWSKQKHKQREKKQFLWFRKKWSVWRKKRRARRKYKKEKSYLLPSKIIEARFSKLLKCGYLDRTGKVSKMRVKQTIIVLGRLKNIAKKLSSFRRPSLKIKT